jgi:hypothetical protein
MTEDGETDFITEHKETLPQYLTLIVKNPTIFCGRT